jgi:hypothetical protein
VLDKTAATSPLVSVLAYKGSLATNSTDATNNDAAYSPAVYVNGKAGVYTVVVYKTAVGVENYTLQYGCLTSTGAVTGTAIKQLQNQ